MPDQDTSADQYPAADETYARPATGDQIDRAAKGLADRAYRTHVVDTVADARSLLARLLPTDQEIFTAVGETLRLSGIAGDIDESGRYRSLRKRLADLAGDIDAQIKAGAAPDVVVGSVHAVTEDGIMVAVSGTGSQLAAYAAGARRAFWVVGAQKVVPDLDTALHRTRAYSLPKEYERLHRTVGSGTAIGKTLIFERELLPDRGTVVLIREPIGF